MKKRVMIFALLALAFIIFSFSVSAVIEVKKSAPSRITLGENMYVDIEINNDGSNVKADVFENVQGIPVFPEEVFVADFPVDIEQNHYYGWHILLKHGKNKISYVIKPDALGTLLLEETSVLIDNYIFQSNVLLVEVMCNKNKVCELELGENFLTCSNDCKSGSQDDICDMESDGIEDPDCPQGDDIFPSFAMDSCNNGMLDYGEEGVDCGAGCSNSCSNKICDPCVRFDGNSFSVSYCNNDSKCDFREIGNLLCDDCKQVYQYSCGDEICNIGEHSSCQQDCFGLRCGNGICEQEENALSCKEDCKISCGDGIISEEEECDISSTSNPTCQQLGYISGTTTCKKVVSYILPNGCKCKDRTCNIGICRNPAGKITKVPLNLSVSCFLDKQCNSCGNNVCEAGDGGFLSCQEDCKQADNNFNGKVSNQEVLLFNSLNFERGDKENAVRWWIES